MSYGPFLQFDQVFKPAQEEVDDYFVVQIIPQFGRQFLPEGQVILEKEFEFLFLRDYRLFVVVGRDELCFDLLENVLCLQIQVGNR